MGISGTHNGCNAVIPYLEAIAPVKNGKIAEPACPNPAIHPMDPVSNQGGISVADWFMRIGYIGPRNNPTIDTATAFPISDGTLQMVTSSLREKRSVNANEEVPKVQYNTLSLKVHRCI